MAYKMRLGIAPGLPGGQLTTELDEKCVSGDSAIVATGCASKTFTHQSVDAVKNHPKIDR